jgi:hypothetical protein
VKHYAFVASAGAYKADDIEPMLVEGDERKASAGHVSGGPPESTAAMVEGTASLRKHRRTGFIEHMHVRSSGMMPFWALS